MNGSFELPSRYSKLGWACSRLSQSRFEQRNDAAKDIQSTSWTACERFFPLVMTQMQRDTAEKARSQILNFVLPGKLWTLRMQLFPVSAM